MPIELHTLSRTGEEGKPKKISCSCGLPFDDAAPGAHAAHALEELRAELGGKSEDRCSNPYFTKDEQRLTFSHCLLDKDHGDTHVFLAIERIYSTGGRTIDTRPVMITVAPFDIAASYRDG